MFVMGCFMTRKENADLASPGVQFLQVASTAHTFYATVPLGRGSGVSPASNRQDFAVDFGVE